MALSDAPLHDNSKIVRICRWSCKFSDLLCIMNGYAPWSRKVRRGPAGQLEIFAALHCP